MNEGQYPLISIITPTYNRGEFIVQAVKSVLEQDYTNFELLIVDDGSTDDTREKLTPYLEDPRIRYFHQENQGQSHARNHALKHASGEYICFLDSDNAWLPNKLSTQIEVFRSHPDVDVVYGDCIIINEKGEEVTRKNMKRYTGRITLQMLKDNCVSMNTAMARRKCFDEMGGLSTKRRVADDYELWLRFSARYHYYYAPQFFAYYRVMEEQISSDKSARFASNEETLKEFREKFPEAVSTADFARALAFFYTRKARHLASVGDKRGALASIAAALRTTPLYVAPWRGLLAILFKGSS